MIDDSGHVPRRTHGGLGSDDFASGMNKVTGDTDLYLIVWPELVRWAEG